MASWRTLAKAILVFVTAIAYTPIATPAEAFASTAGTSAERMGATDDSDGGQADPGDDEADGPPPCLPGNAPSAVTGRCVPDFPEHECPDGGMSIWNRCPRSVPCEGGGASVNGECPGPAERFCDEGVSFEGSCGEDAAAVARLGEESHGPRASTLAGMSSPSLVFG